MPSPPAQQARAFSHSRLAMLDDCPRRYRYRYVDREPESFRSVEAFTGTLVHEVLAWAYLEREEGRMPSPDELARRLREEWDRQHGPEVKVVRPGDLAVRHRAAAEDMVRRHAAGRLADDRLETLAVEPKVSFEVGGQSYVGYVDRLARDPEDGTLHVIDFKTGKRLPRTPEEAGTQLRGYGVAVLETHGGLEVALEFHYLRHDVSVRETLTRSQTHEVAGEIGDRIAAALEAESRGDFPARPGPVCAWCGYNDRCEAAPRSSPDPVAAPGDRTCPRCRGDLRLRQGRRGPFLGCSGFPACRYTRDPHPEEVPS